MTDKEILTSMVQECVSDYEAHESEDGSTVITIHIPKRFANLWLVKLSNLRTTLREIEEFENIEEG